MPSGALKPVTDVTLVYHVSINTSFNMMHNETRDDTNIHQNFTMPWTALTGHLKLMPITPCRHLCCSPEAANVIQGELRAGRNIPSCICMGCNAIKSHQGMPSA
jgi:hypothetical protein